MYMLSESEEIQNTQAMFVVPKRIFKRAHDRNLLKRRMREAYRLSKNDFYTLLGEKKAIMAFIYTGKKTEGFAQILQSLQRHLSLIAARTKA